MPSTKDIDNPVVDLILNAMESKGHTTAQAARAMGMSQSQLKSILDRTKAVGTVTAPPIARYLGVSESYLFAIAGLAPAREDDADYYDHQIRELTKNLPTNEKRRVVDVVRALLGGKSKPDSEKSKIKWDNVYNDDLLALLAAGDSGASIVVDPTWRQ